MVIAWLAAAWAGTVCDPVAAAALLADARIPEHRAPVTHPDLLPGIALASANTDDALRLALGELCTDPERLTVTPTDAWDDAGWSAHSFLLTASETRGCTLVQRAVAVSVGIPADAPPVYRLRGRLPMTTTPIGACPSQATWRDETVLAGGAGKVRVVLAVDRSGESIVASQVLARRAGPEGWTEQTLLSPAPHRYLGGFDGPALALAEGDGTMADSGRWIVAHHDRTGSPDDCEPVPGQSVWTWRDDTWEAHEGRDALYLLARRGLWRFAGDDGWLHIVAQDDEEDDEVLGYREARLGRRYPEPLHMFVSADFPGLNPGFLVLAPAPFPTEADALAAKRQWRSLHRNYVKRAWQADDACASE